MTDGSTKSYIPTWDSHFYCKNIIEIDDIVKHDRIEAFHDFMIKTIQEYAEFPEKLKQVKSSIASCIVIANCGTSNKFLGILIDDYEYEITVEFVRYHLCMDIGPSVLSVFTKYFDLHDFMVEMRQFFKRMCIRGTVTDLQKILDYGFNIHDLTMSTSAYYNENIFYYAISNPDTAIVKYLLDCGIGFQEFQSDILKICVQQQRIDQLRVFVEYGVDLEILNKCILSRNNDYYVNMYKFLLENKVDPLAILLSFVGR